MRIIVWLYLAMLIVITLAHINLQAELGNPFDIYRVIALCLAGLLARLAYASAPSFAFLMIIGTVGALVSVHALAIGDNGRPMDIIIDMASGLWGVALGAVRDKLRRVRRPSFRSDDNGALVENDSRS